jgi:nitrogen fixation protein NifU and related proteins
LLRPAQATKRGRKPIYKKWGASPIFCDYNAVDMNDLDELKKRLQEVYSDTTIDHVLHPRNTDPISHPDGFGEMDSGHGEGMKIWLRVRNEMIQDSAFWTNGCAATIACGSMATELVREKSVSKALALTAADIADALGNLPEGNYHCAEMAAAALRLALKDCLAMQREPWKKLYRK